jgi:8-oxo-dGTP diphosphatase
MKKGMAGNNVPIKVYLGVKAVIVETQRLLVVKKTVLEPTRTRTFWDLPGGRIASGESLEQALIREVHEELPNLTSFQVGKLLYALKKATPIADGSEICFLYYQAQATFASATIALSPEHSEYSWVSAEEIQTFTEPAKSIYSILLSSSVL